MYLVFSEVFDTRKSILILLTISIIILALFAAAGDSGIGPPGSGKSSSTGGSIQISTSYSSSQGGGYSQTIGGAHASGSHSQRNTWGSDNSGAPSPISPPNLESQEVATKTSTRIIVPNSVFAPNSFYTPSAPYTISTCNTGQEIPLILDIRTNGPLYLYEWYPNGELSTQFMGNIANSGLQSLKFYGDLSGFHVLQYYCNGWSNYIYVYVI